MNNSVIIKFYGLLSFNCLVYTIVIIDCLRNLHLIASNQSEQGAKKKRLDFFHLKVLP